MPNIFLQATAPRKKVYPRHINGQFHRLRGAISAILQAFLFLLPWVPWNGQQAVLFDLPGRKIFIFDLVLQPQETYFLHVLLVTAALTLFAVTAVAGRMWCGYACPETLFSQSFIAVERFFEGDRAQRQRLDKRPWDAEKIRIKLAKFTVWTVMGGYLGFTFAGYFTPIRELVADMATGHPHPSTIFSIALFTAISLFFFGWFREQFCNFLCPYARFQGAMLDENSLIVGYDFNRGEPRGKVKGENHGDCIDCTMCVQVCPTGIDIRKGLQLECIACAACVDACDEVMDKVKKPRGLVRYTSLQELKGQPTQVIRPRVIVYGVLLTMLGTIFCMLLATRKPLGLDAVRQPPGGGRNFTLHPDGRVSNPYRVHIMNRTRQPQAVTLSIEGFPGAELVTPDNPYTLQPGEVATLTALVLHTPQGLPLVQKFTMKAQTSEATATRAVNFLSQ